MSPGHVGLPGGEQADTLVKTEQGFHLVGSLDHLTLPLQKPETP